MLNKTDSKPAETTHTLITSPRSRSRYWIAVRVVDYRIQALAPCDSDDPQGEQDWSDIGCDTTVSTDREAIFQLARQHNGLLLSMSGLPAVGRLRALVNKQTEAAAQSDDQGADKDVPF